MERIYPAPDVFATFPSDGKIVPRSGKKAANLPLTPEPAAENVLPDSFIFPSSRGTAIHTNNFLFRVLKEAGKKAQIKGVMHQMLRRTCSTYMAQLTTVKDVQAHLRHSSSATTLEHFIKSVPESVRVAVESLDHLLKKAPADSGQPAN